MQEHPTLKEDSSTLYVRCWFPTSNVIVKVDVLEVAKFADDFQMVAIISFLQENLSHVANFNKDKTADLKKYATMAGDDPLRRTRSQNQRKEQIKLDEPASFTTGYLYSDYQVVEYRPEKLMKKNQCIAAQQVSFDETMLNDCTSLSVNQLLRFPFFTMREQVQRLWKESLCTSDSYVNSRKLEKGVSIISFKDFFVKKHFSYSIVEVEEFKGLESHAALKKFVYDNMEKGDKFREILITCSLIDDKW